MNQGFNVIELADGESFKESIDDIKAHVAILDLNLPGIDGMKLLPLLRKTLKIPTIIYTGEGNLSLAHEATALGAYEFLSKPVRCEFLLPVLRNAIENEKLKRENLRLRRTDDIKYGFANLVGVSKAMQKVFNIIRQIAPGNATVLVRGTTGTGKDLVAEAIHKHSNRCNGPFVPLNCAALSPSLAESTLFGHEKGTFTGATTTYKGLLEQANGGTLVATTVGGTLDNKKDSSSWTEEYAVGFSKISFLYHRTKNIPSFLPMLLIYSGNCDSIPCFKLS